MHTRSVVSMRGRLSEVALKCEGHKMGYWKIKERIN